LGFDPFSQLAMPLIHFYLNFTMTLRNQLDDTDLQILDIVTKNARIPFKDVAVACGISRAAVHQRVTRMMDMEVIVGSVYTVDPKKIDYRTCSYIGLFLEKGSMYSEVAEQLRQIKEIVECHYITAVSYTHLTLPTNREV